MRLKQAERRERERAEEVEREKQRRKHGQELLHIKQKLQDDELKKMADLRSREKMEDKMAKYVSRHRVTDVRGGGRGQAGLPDLIRGYSSGLGEKLVREGGVCCMVQRF